MDHHRADHDGVAAKQLEVKYRDYIELLAEIEVVERKYLSATDPKQIAAFHRIYMNLLDTKQELNDELRGVDVCLIDAGQTPWIYNPAEWDNERSCACLTEFTKAALAQKELILHPKPNTVISLGGNVAWLGMPSLATADLYVRSCYPELLEARELALNRQILRDAHCGGDARWREGCVNIFTGSSGVGKSHLAALFVAQALLKGSTVLLECLEDSRVDGPKLVQTQESEDPAWAKRHYCWITSSGVDHTTNSSAAERRLKKYKDLLRPVCSVSVGCIQGFEWSGHAYIFCNPNKDLFRPLRKGWMYYMYFYMPALELNELLSMRKMLPRYKVLSEQSVRRWYSWAGGSAKACLAWNDKEPHRLTSWKEKIKIVLGQASPSDLLIMIRKDGGPLWFLNGMEKDSDKLFHFFCRTALPETDDASPKGRYEWPVFRMASQNIRNLVLIHLGLD